MNYYDYYYYYRGNKVIVSFRALVRITISEKKTAQIDKKGKKREKIGLVKKQVLTESYIFLGFHLCGPHRQKTRLTCVVVRMYVWVCIVLVQSRIKL